MTRTTRPPADAEACEEPQMRRHWLDWAAAQIDASLALDRDAAESLMAAVAELLESLAAPRGQAHERVVAAVQVHDRLMQQLTHVGAALRGLAELAAAARPIAREEWSALRRQQLDICTMHEERALLRRMVPDACADAVPEPAHRIDAGSIELFQ